MNALELVASSIARPFVGRVRASGRPLNDVLADLYTSGALPLMLNQTLRGDREEVESSYAGYVSGLYLRSPVVFGVLSLRARLFAEMPFAFQQLRNNKPGQLFGTRDLAILENPEPGKTRAEMLSTAILDADIAGDAFNLRRPDRIRRLRPDWTVIAYGSKQDKGLGGWDPDAEIIGYGYYPGGIGSGNPVQTYLPEEVSHFVTNRDPLARNRGMSLLTPLVREVMADSAATAHKLAFFQNGATANLLVTFPPELDKEAADEWIELFEQEHSGALNAYKALYLGGGPQATAIGSNMEQMTFAELQGKAETRIAQVAGMHPVVAALSEGMQGSSLNAGNFGQAARLVADTTLRTLWRDVCGAFAQVVPALPGARLWYDEDGIAFLRDDVKDQAEIRQKDAATIGQLIRDGFTPASAIDAVTSSDMNRLVHTGLVSVQLQIPGSQPSAPAPAPGAFSVPAHKALEPFDRPAAYRVRTDFWPLQEPFAGVGMVPRGTTVPADHPLVAAFGSVLEPDVEPVGQIVSRARVLEVQRALIDSGKDAGYDSVAKELNVSRETVRRRMKEQ